MAGTLVKSVMLKIVSNDGDTEAKLDKITAKAEELARLHPELTPKVNIAAASAKLGVLRKELKDTGNAAADDTSTSLKSRLMSLGAAAATAGGFGGFSKDASLATKIMSGFSLATGLLEAPMAGAVVGVGALASGFAAAGMGAGVFGIVAKGVFTQVSANIKAAAAAQQAIASGDTGKKLAADNKALAASLKGLSAGQQQIVLGAANSETYWHNFTRSAADGVSKVLVPAMGMVPQALSLAQKFLGPVETGLTSIVSKVQAKISSKGFISEIGDFAKASGPDLEKVAAAAGHVVMGVLGILHAFLPMSGQVLGGLDKLTGKFETWGQTLTSHSGFQSLVSMAKQDMPLVIQVVKNLGSAFVGLGGSMTGLSTFSNSKSLLQLAVPLTHLLDVLVNLNPSLTRFGLYALAAGGAVSKMKPAFQGISAGLLGLDKGVGLLGKFGGAAEEAGRGTKIAAAATRVWTGVQAAFDVVMAMNPIGLVVIAIAALVAGVIFAYMHFKAFRDVVKSVFHEVTVIVGAAVSWIGSHWKLIAAILTGPIGLATLYITTHWHQIVSGASAMVGSVVSFFRSLPGRIMGAVGNLGRLLWQGGVNLVMGLVHGIESVAMAPVHALGGIVSGLRSLLPFSPAKKGPLSGAGSPDIAGRKVGLMFAAGISGTSGTVAAAAARMAGAAGMAGQMGGAAAPRGGPQVTLSLAPGGTGLDQLLWTYLQKQIRVHGGDPRILTQKVSALT